jgi:iron complex outermembrane recepter protein
MNRLALAWLLAPALLLATCLPTAASFASEDSPAEEAVPPPTDPEPAIVTGSRLRRDGTTTPAPVSVITRDDLSTSGKTEIGDTLQQVPYQSNAVNSAVNHDGDGSTRINLRGLGSSRTLVLIDGHRMAAGGNGANASVDLNVIPRAVVDRVEILRDGGSAIYGSGAVGGVVNIITRRDLQGQETDTYYGTDQDGRGRVRALSHTSGNAWNRGHILFSASYSEQEGLLSDRREFSRFDREFDYFFSQAFVVGSTATPEGIIRDSGEGPGNELWQDTRAEHGPFLTFDPGTGTWRGVRGGSFDSGIGDFYNYRPDNYLITPRTLTDLYAAGRADLTTGTRAYVQVAYNRRRSEQQLAPEPLFTTLLGITVSADNAYNPFGRDFMDLRRRTVENGPRVFHQDIDTSRFVGGVEGDLPLLKIGYWDASFIYNRSSAGVDSSSHFLTSRLMAALGPSFFDQDGRARCGTPAVPGPADCVPMNLFGGPGSITSEMLGYTTFMGNAMGYNELRMVSARAAGELFSLGGPFSMAAGFEYREEEGGISPDPITESGDHTGLTIIGFEGGYDVKEAFAEVNWVLEPNWRLVRAFELDAGIRQSDYSSFGHHTSWKTGVLWRMSGNLALRGTVGRSFSAPDVSQLFRPQPDAFQLASDPCDWSFGPPDLAASANCAADGRPDDFFDHRLFFLTRTGGNPDLGPEKANTFTFGFVFEPSEVPGLSLASSQFRYDLTGLITDMDVGVLLANCYFPTDRRDCDRITRDPATFLIESIDGRLTNAGAIETKGWDLNVAYSMDLPFGTMNLSLDAVYLRKYDLEQPNGRIIQGKGVWGNLGANPRRRANLGAGFQMRSIGFNSRIRYVGHFKECENGVDCGDFFAPRRNVGAHYVADLQGRYRLRAGAGETTLGLGVNNVFDKDPALIYSGLHADSDAATYDYVGRFIYFNLTRRW